VNFMTIGVEQTAKATSLDRVERYPGLVLSLLDSAALHSGPRAAMPGSSVVVKQILRREITIPQTFLFFGLLSFCAEVYPERCNLPMSE
jgi:hypothetical protein